VLLGEHALGRSPRAIPLTRHGVDGVEHAISSAEEAVGGRETTVPMSDSTLPPPCGWYGRPTM
jgi:hypothetical protein